MKNRLLLGAVLLLAIRPVVAQDATDFVGTWELVTIERTSDSGEWVPVMFSGDKPVGIIMYDDLGNMAVQITTSPRNTLTPGGTSEFVNGYIAYYAKYDVDIPAGTVTHHRRNHLNRDVGGLSVVRYFSFEGDVLTLTVAPERTLRLTWSRAQ